MPKTQREALDGIIILLRCYEKRVVVAISLLLIVLNLASLYFIINLMTYDEIVGYLSDGKVKNLDPRDFVSILLITTLFNILFVFTALCSRSAE